jgi:hypothetical protein
MMSVSHPFDIAGIIIFHFNRWYSTKMPKTGSNNTHLRSSKRFDRFELNSVCCCPLHYMVYVCSCRSKHACMHACMTIHKLKFIMDTISSLDESATLNTGPVILVVMENKRCSLKLVFRRVPPFVIFLASRCLVLQSVCCFCLTYTW